MSYPHLHYTHHHQTTFVPVFRNIHLETGNRSQDLPSTTLYSNYGWKIRTLLLRTFFALHGLPDSVHTSTQGKEEKNSLSCYTTHCLSNSIGLTTIYTINHSFTYPTQSSLTPPYIENQY